MCERTESLRAAGVRSPDDEAHLAVCGACARALAADALRRAGLGGGPVADEDEVALFAGGLATPEEARRARRAMGDGEEQSMTRSGNGRTDHSVLISLDTLTPTMTPRAERPAEASGLIDLAALGLDGPVAPSGAAAPEAMAPRAAVALPARRSRRPLAWAAAAAVALVGVSAAATYALLGRRGEVEAPVATTGGPAPAPAVAAAERTGAAAGAAVGSEAAPAGGMAAGEAAPAGGVAAAGAAVGSEAAPASVAAAAGGAVGEAPVTAGSAVAVARPAVRPAARVGPAAAAPKASAAPKAAEPPQAAEAPEPPAVAVAATPRAAASNEVDELLGALDGKGARPAAGTRPAPAAAPDPMLRAQLDRADILRVVKANAGAVQACKERQSGVRGTVTVRLSIGGDGRVTSAAASGPLAGSPVGACVEGVARGMRFPQFSGDPMSINLPFAL